MVVMGLILYRILQIYMWLLIARMVLSWVPLILPDFRPSGFIAAIFEAIYTVTDPPLKMANRYIPPLNLGAIGLDVGFMVVVLLVIVLQRAVLVIFF